MKRKQFWNSMAIGLALCMAAGWWGILYPQLTLNTDTYRIVTKDGEVSTCADENWESDGTVVYMEMLNADRSQLRFRCRFVEEIKEYLESIRRN